MISRFTLSMSARAEMACQSSEGVKTLARGVSAHMRRSRRRRRRHSIKKDSRWTKEVLFMALNSSLSSDWVKYISLLKNRSTWTHCARWVRTASSSSNHPRRFSHPSGIPFLWSSISSCRVLSITRPWQSRSARRAPESDSSLGSSVGKLELLKALAAVRAAPSTRSSLVVKGSAEMAVVVSAATRSEYSPLWMMRRMDSASAKVTAAT
mmetsp:Transcript_15728/g.21172  ORF Transcript_15728/g.21172 Transcript_15728/m.21172 type:complete len:209 (+) Transcript_15728:955-1581(+)